MHSISMKTYNFWELSFIVSRQNISLNDFYDYFNFAIENKINFANDMKKQNITLFIS